MAATTCDDCGGKVNEQAWKCPHCGAKREGVARGKLSNDEVRALIATGDSVKDDEGKGLAETLLFPHPETRGAARTIEIALTVVCAPFVIIGIAAMALGRARMRMLYRSVRGEGMSAFVMTFFGSAPFYYLLAMLHAPSPFYLVLASIALLWVRAYIRARTGAWKSRELNRLVKAEQRASQPALPPARAKQVSRPTTGPAVAVPTAPRVDPPRAEPQTASGDEPRLLR
ncbi:MAG: hypothetical protein JO257_13530 [Deltaproteobacteria bacterium]|nr:hypothetical protein [Deltaproteobacteria bacterium]